MSEVEGLAKFGLFLFLAFILPGMIYTGFMLIYFPETLAKFGWDINSWVGFFGLSIFLGLLITSICFAIEVLIIWPIFKRKNWRLPKIILLGVFEAKRIPTFYINQVFGQYINHLNIGLGVLLLTVCYAITLKPANIADLEIILSSDCFYKFTFGLVISAVNIFLALRVFRNFSVSIEDEYDKICHKKTTAKSAAIFDLDNTIIDTYGIYRNAKLELTKKIMKFGGKITNKNKFVSELFKLDREFCKRFNTWNYDQQKFVAEACRIAECKNCNIETLAKAYETELKKTPKPFKGAMQTLRTLKNRGVYLVLLSEGSKEHQEATLKKHGIDEMFDLSWFVKRKEEKDFDLIVKKLQRIGYTNVYLVGDSIKKDIRLGNSVGAQTIWIPSEWEVEKPDELEDWPKHRVKKIEEILTIIE